MTRRLMSAGTRSLNLALASAREGDSLSSSDSASGTREHERHCDCVEELTGQIELLKTEKEKLEVECQSLRDVNQKLSSLRSHVFSIDRIKADNKLISFYTRFSSFLVLLSCFNFLRRSAEVMQVGKASATTREDVARVGLKPGPMQAEASSDGAVLFCHGSFTSGLERC